MEYEGFNRPLKRKKLRMCIDKWKITCGAVLETRIRQHNLCSVLSFWDSSIWSTVDNGALDKNCRILVY